MFQIHGFNLQDANNDNYTLPSSAKAKKWRRASLSSARKAKLWTNAGFERRDRSKNFSTRISRIWNGGCKYVCIDNRAHKRFKRLPPNCRKAISPAPKPFDVLRPSNGRCQAEVRLAAGRMREEPCPEDSRNGLEKVLANR